MKEYPILFNDEMVRAYLDGRKTQTRRPVTVKWLPIVDEVMKTNGRWTSSTVDYDLTTPFGGPGDRLWVMECWRVAEWDGPHNEMGFDYRADGGDMLNVKCPEGATYTRLVCQSVDQVPCNGWGWQRGDSPLLWRPNIHMPRWASRITLEVTRLWVERIQDICTADIAAEGVDNGKSNPAMGKRHDAMQQMAFTDLWNSIYATKGFGWDENPWVWACSFTRVQP